MLIKYQILRSGLYINFSLDFCLKARCSAFQCKL